MQKGWLIFGPRPLDTLAVTFVNAWTEENDKPEILTVYLSFADVAGQRPSGKCWPGMWRRGNGRYQPPEDGVGVAVGSGGTSMVGGGRGFTAGHAGHCSRSS
ncbi:MAG: hypothetical protein IPG51_12990 [Chloroflexi bacterium]|nr:hypothetical protein [Chloroflexota bacterium]